MVLKCEKSITTLIEDLFMNAAGLGVWMIPSELP
jgi:hypothetical protein